MDSDPALQKAILASIRSANTQTASRFTSSFSNDAFARGADRAAASLSRRSSVDNFTASVRPRAYRRDDSPEKTSYGHRDCLRRSGIAPALSNQRRTVPQQKRALERCKNFPTQRSISPQRINNEPTSRHQKQSGNGREWTKASGTGSFEVQQTGNLEYGYVENTQAELCLLRSSIDVKPDFHLQFEFKCAHAAPASKNVPAFRLVMWFEANGAGLDYTAVHVDCLERVWTVEHVLGNKKRELYKVPDRELRPGMFHTLRLEICNSDTLSLFCNDRCPVHMLSIPEDVEVSGPIGFGVTKSRLTFRNFESRESSGVPPSNSIKPYMDDDPQLIEIIQRDIIDHDLKVTFDDIASLETAKRLLDEAVTLPLIIPEFFTGIREPWKGVLLFGPPGTGKTLLAKALANMHNIRFFNCTCSTLMSKWRGESEKLVRVVFSMARHYAPSIVFFDEADALMSARGVDAEHEASRRFKSELLQQIDGVGTVKDAGKHVMVLATSNHPWLLDEAMRRRLEKRIYIPLPDEAARHELLKINLKDVKCGTTVDLQLLARRLQGYSGADIRLVCRDASLMPMRRLIAKKTPKEIKAMRDQGELEVELGLEDFNMAIQNTHPSVTAGDTLRFEKWNKEFASV